jgi:hypothetical protein
MRLCKQSTSRSGFVQGSNTRSIADIPQQTRPNQTRIKAILYERDYNPPAPFVRAVVSVLNLEINITNNNNCISIITNNTATTTTTTTTTRGTHLEWSNEDEQGITLGL